MTPVKTLLLIAALVTSAGTLQAATSEAPGTDLSLKLTILPDKPVAKAPAFLSIHDVRFTSGEFAGEIAHHVSYVVTVEDAAGNTLLGEEWFHSHFDGRVDWIYTFPAPGEYTLTIRPEPTMPGMRTQGPFTVEERSFPVTVLAAPDNGQLTPELEIPEQASAGERLTFDYALLHPDGSPVVHTDTRVLVQSAQEVFEVGKIHTHTGEFSLDWTPAHGGPHRVTFVTTPTGDTPEPFPPTLVSRKLQVAGEAPAAGAAFSAGGGDGSTPAERNLEGAEYVLPLKWGPANPVAGQPVRFDVAGIHWKDYDAKADSDLPAGLRERSQVNAEGKTVVSHVTYIVEVLGPDGERTFFSDWFHSHFDGALGFRYTFPAAGDYVLTIRPEPTMPGMRTQKAFTPETFEVPFHVDAAPEAPYDVDVADPRAEPGRTAAFAFSPLLPDGRGKMTHTDTRVSLVSTDFAYIVEKVHSHTGDYAFQAALPEGTYTLSGLTTFTGDTPEEDRHGPNLFAQTFAVGDAPVTAPGKAADPAPGQRTPADDGADAAGGNDVPAPGLLAALLGIALSGWTVRRSARKGGR